MAVKAKKNPFVETIREEFADLKKVFKDFASTSTNVSKSINNMYSGFDDLAPAIRNAEKEAQKLQKTSEHLVKVFGPNKMALGAQFLKAHASDYASWTRSASTLTSELAGHMGKLDKNTSSMNRVFKSAAGAFFQHKSSINAYAEALKKLNERMDSLKASKDKGDPFTKEMDAEARYIPDRIKILSIEHELNAALAEHIRFLTIMGGAALDGAKHEFEVHKKLLGLNMDYNRSLTVTQDLLGASMSAGYLGELDKTVELFKDLTNQYKGFSNDRGLLRTSVQLNAVIGLSGHFIANLRNQMRVFGADGAEDFKKVADSMTWFATKSNLVGEDVEKLVSAAEPLILQMPQGLKGTLIPQILAVGDAFKTAGLNADDMLKSLTDMQDIFNSSAMQKAAMLSAFGGASFNDYLNGTDIAGNAHKSAGAQRAFMKRMMAGGLNAASAASLGEQMQLGSRQELLKAGQVSDATWSEMEKRFAIDQKYEQQTDALHKSLQNLLQGPMEGAATAFHNMHTLFMQLGVATLQAWNHLTPFVGWIGDIGNAITEFLSGTSQAKDVILGTAGVITAVLLPLFGIKLVTKVMKTAWAAGELTLSLAALSKMLQKTAGQAELRALAEKYSGGLGGGSTAIPGVGSKVERDVAEAEKKLSQRGVWKKLATGAGSVITALIPGIDDLALLAMSNPITAVATIIGASAVTSALWMAYNDIKGKGEAAKQAQDSATNTESAATGIPAERLARQKDMQTQAHWRDRDMKTGHAQFEITKALVNSENLLLQGIKTDEQVRIDNTDAIKKLTDVTDKTNKATTSSSTWGGSGTSGTWGSVKAGDIKYPSNTTRGQYNPAGDSGSSSGSNEGGSGEGASFQPDTSGSNRLNAKFNNPGALGPTKSALKYGGVPSGKTDTGHSFMKFPTKEAGAAAQFSMWQYSGLYRNHTLKDAITNWIGPGEHGEAEYISKRTGIPLNTVITDELLRGPTGVKLMQAQAQYEGANVLTNDQWQLAQDWAYKGINPSSINSKINKTADVNIGGKKVDSEVKTTAITPTTTQPQTSIKTDDTSTKSTVKNAVKTFVQPDIRTQSDKDDELDALTKKNNRNERDTKDQKNAMNDSVKIQKAHYAMMKERFQTRTLLSAHPYDDLKTANA